LAHDEAPTRRDLFKSASLGIGLGAALAAPLLPRIAEAAAMVPGTDPVWYGEYWAEKGPVRLAMYRKRKTAPRAGEKPLPVLFLVHGSSLSGRGSFDITAPGIGEYSLMNVFARLGYDVWTMDHEGYGRSTQTAGNSDIASGVEDLKAASIVLARETRQSKYSFFGESSGALRAAAFAVARPEAAERLMLAALTYTGKDSPTLGKRAEDTEYFRTHNRRKRDLAMIRSIFTRDKPGTSDPRLGDVIAKYELQFGDSVPTGTYLDMTANLPVVDPTKVSAPVMILRGEYDGIASEADVLDFFQHLPNSEREFVVLAGAAHSVVFSNTRRQLWHVMEGFLTMPAGLSA
jgi:alpha-beta hydrolase superfamily lysophospholipase